MEAVEWVVLAALFTMMADSVALVLACGWMFLAQSENTTEIVKGGIDDNAG